MSSEATETTIARLDERFKSLEVVMRELAQDQRGLNQAYTELVAQGARFAAVEGDVAQIKESNGKLWALLREAQTRRAHFMEGVASKGFEWAGLMLIGAIAAHYGIKLLL